MDTSGTAFAFQTGSVSSIRSNFNATSERAFFNIATMSVIASSFLQHLARTKYLYRYFFHITRQVSQKSGSTSKESPHQRSLPIGASVDISHTTSLVPHQPLHLGPHTTTTTTTTTTIVESLCQHPVITLFRGRLSPQPARPSVPITGNSITCRLTFDVTQRHPRYSDCPQHHHPHWTTATRAA